MQGHSCLLRACLRNVNNPVWGIQAEGSKQVAAWVSVLAWAPQGQQMITVWMLTKHAGDGVCVCATDLDEASNALKKRNAWDGFSCLLCTVLICRYCLVFDEIWSCATLLLQHIVKIPICSSALWQWRLRRLPTYLSSRNIIELADLCYISVYPPHDLSCTTGLHWATLKPHF